MQIPFFSSAPMHQPLKVELDAFWQKFYDSNWYVLGPEVEAFEAAYAAFNQTRFCVGVANGLDALHIALKALGVGPGDEVIVPSNTYIASWLGVSQVGAIPVPVEPDPHTWNIDPQRIEAAISTRTRVIMPVHLYGQACEMGPIMELATRYDVALVEDNAQAHGARWQGKLTGSFGQINGVSFYPTKNLGALGDAGAVTTNDSALADFAKMYRNYGSRQRYYNEMPGLNSRLDAVQAGILRIKLAHLASWNAEREVLANRYLEQLRGIKQLRLPTLGTDCTSVWHLFVVLAERRDALQVYLQERGIGTLIHYPLPPHLQEAYFPLGFKRGQFPIAEQIAQKCLSLPLYPGMPVAHLDQVVDAIGAFYQS
ncbi:DegT/DnrJ/EryC1/StrS family aminotransferase [Haliscomenobacter sp.]|uniref:DegT/DnrJ/EryC1/StrS family aminotransferase n=1 Tax=Haliscomenobacter sp. TaxID=2717303 RepID=UPI003593DAA7